MLLPDEIVIREYKEGDEAQINLLHNKEYGTNRGIEEWRWEFRDGPYGESILAVAEHNGEIVGTQAQLPILLSYGGQEILSAKTEATHLKKGYRGQGILERLHNKCDELAAKRGMALFCGFDKENVAKSHMRSQYQVPGKLRYLALVLDPSQTYQMFRDRIPADVKKCLPSQFAQKLLLLAFTLAGFLWFKARIRKMNPSSRFRVLPITEADERLDAFWEVFCQKGNFYTIARTSKYLDWRIFRNPNVLFHFLTVVDDDRIQGYVILGRSKHANTGFVTDFCVLDEHFEEVAGLLISHAVDYFRSQGIAFVSAWHVGNNPEAKRCSYWLRKFGFLPTPVKSCVVLKVLAEEGSLPTKPSDLNQWFITELFSEGVG